MKVIIAGSREFPRDVFENAVANCGMLTEATEIVSGTARGPDTWGEAVANKLGIPVKRFPADWDGLGKRAGYVRNAEMADYADALLVFWDGASRGTKHMIDLARKRNLAIIEVRSDNTISGH